uniref:Protein TIC110, chloroplastic n=1 Tax=Salix viminalis TaxID=40686 RepID=A0A6N2M226_SALVM
MTPSLLTSSPSTSFLSPCPLKLTPSSLILPKRHRFRVSFPRSSAAESPSVITLESKPNDIFGGKRELSGVRSIVSNLSPPLRLVSSAVILAGALAAGYGLGTNFGGGSRNLALGGAAVTGAAVRGEIEGIAKKFVSSVLPPGGEELRGNEVETIISFKNALGIDDPDAASMHVEHGRRIFRQRLETGDPDGDVEQRRAFQKLIYVSTLVFGEASSFLLPWKRVFKVTDSQVEIAIRDNAQRLYTSRGKISWKRGVPCSSTAINIDVEQLFNLRQAQISYRLSDKLAEDLFRQHTRTLIEENISAALDRIKSRTRTVQDIAKVVEELDKILAFNNMLISLKNHTDAASFACGVGPVSVLGGEYGSERKIDDLKLLYRAYITEALYGGRMEEHKLAALNQLKNIFGLGKREGESIKLDVTSKNMLIAKQPSYNIFVKSCILCPQKATEIHEEIYREKLQHCAADGELSDEDVKALTRLRVMLCIAQQTIDAAHSDICGSLFEKVVKDAIASGVDGYDADVKKAVRKAAHGLRLTREAAISIAGKAVRRIFLNYIKRARMADSRTEGAKELRKLIAFNSSCGESSDTPPEEPSKVEENQVEEDEEWRDDEEWESLETLKKIRPSEEVAAKMGKPGQTEINLKDDLPERDRTDLYKTYLLYCLTGEVTRIPFGAQITTKKDDSEYLLLNQLGGILGLTVMEIVEVHRSLAEQTFRKQAEVILADGQLTKPRIEQLNDLQKQVGLPPEYAQKVIKNITTTKMGAALETAINRGGLNMKQIRELKEASIDFNSMISENLRENLYKKTVDEIFSSGTGEFDEEEVYEKIPEDLNINLEKAKGVVHELARSRLSNSLVQAVALLRQRNQQGVVSTLNDLLACDKAVPSEPLTWEVPEELADLYAIHMKNNPAPEKLSRLQYLLGISDSTATALGELKDRVLPIGTEEEKFVF